MGFPYCFSRGGAEIDNLLERLRSGASLTDKEKALDAKGLVSLLLDLHQKLDAAVAQAYGWPVELSDADILDRLVALNHERAAPAPGPSVEPPKGKSIQKRRTAE